MQNKCRGKLVAVNAAKAYGGVALQLHTFLNSTLNEGDW